ncbi:tRNA-specific adenosine deaminase 1-like [Amphibalanus amphitrite]|uniref:tRNA-specific adenosine deaminase 1-like n=1 Tax=Amphibalanus amphitrite TaxID=1232801 RepID=UPI001C9208D3|nr:tRNA-specific adenosine deaminase 1-like [Amphibalanus amphitrite]
MADPDEDVTAAAIPSQTELTADTAGRSISTATVPPPFTPPAGFPDLIATACYDQFSRLPRRARPQASREWALLAGFLLSSPPHTQPVVVALGTGSKCLGASQLSATGEKLADSHAEVVARRAFRRFLMAEVRRAVVGGGESQWLEKEESGRCVRLKEGVRVHFFTSHTPCGDCSIFPRKNETEYDAGDERAMKKQRCEEEHEPKRIALEDGEAVMDSLPSAENLNTSVSDASDIYRTGAKPVVGETADPLQPGAGYHVTGVLRTKPGRGERTLSMSCSDKLARWLRLGLQGALLSCWLPQPLTLSSVVTGPCPYSEAAMRRALLGRPGLIVEPVLAQAGKEFEFSRTLVEGSAAEGVKVVPSPCAVTWSRGCTREFEVSVEGIRQGVTKKARGTPAARVAICRREVMQEFVELAKDVALEQLPACLRDEDSLSVLGC